MENQNDYWIGRWKRGETGWHQTEVEQDLVKNFKNISGRGILGEIDGKKLFLGNIHYLKENNFTSSLDKLKQFEKKRGYKYSLWEHHSDTFTITSESMFMQKVSYIHLNPIRAELVGNIEDYLYSSIRIWKRKPLENEPLEMDLNQIKWRDG